MKNLLWFLVLILNITTKSQNSNYIFNYDFETLKNGSSWPTGVGQADNMSSWETRTQQLGTLYMHSPDWINSNGSGNQTSWPRPLNAHTGNGMIGMTNYELIQQLFNNGNNMDGSTFHTISMWVYMPSTSSKNCRLKIMFAKNRLKYKNENLITGNQNSNDHCNQDYIDYHNSLSSYTTIHEFDFNNINITYDTWQKVSFTFKTPPSNVLNDYDFFAMELRKNGYNPGSVSGNCEDSYIFIDDISLVKSDFCNAACAPNLGNITYGNIPNVMFSNYAWGFTVVNAIGIDFTLYDRWGQVILDTESAFDPNGLIDAGYPNYAFGWNSPGLPEDTYIYTLKMWNCHQTINKAGQILIINQGSPSSLGYNIQNFELNDCCPNDRYIQNTTYIGDYIHTAKNNIWAGHHVTNSQPFGLVIVNSGVDVKYVAKNISIQSGFVVQPGAKFKAIPTEDCVYQPVFRLKPRERFPIEENITSSEMFNKKNNTVFNDNTVVVYPNPSNGVFNILPLKEEILSIDVYNNTGSIIYTCNKSNNTSLINLTNEADGTYFYKIIFNNGETSKGKVIKKSSNE